MEGNSYSITYGTIPVYPPAVLRNHISKIDHNVIFPSLAGPPNKGFPTDFLTPDQYINKTISFLKTEAVNSIATAMTAPSLRVNASGSMLSAFSPCRYIPRQVAAAVFHPLVHSAVRSAGKLAAAVT